MREQRSGQGSRLLEYDVRRHRLWIRGQRCHHGATGTVVALLACLALVAESAEASGPHDRSVIALALTGGALMAHDWKDRSFWFERGRGSQP